MFDVHSDRSQRPDFGADLPRIHLLATWNTVGTRRSAWRLFDDVALGSSIPRLSDADLLRVVQSAIPLSPAIAPSVSENNDF